MLDNVNFLDGCFDKAPKLKSLDLDIHGNNLNYYNFDKIFSSKNSNVEILNLDMG